MAVKAANVTSEPFSAAPPVRLIEGEAGGLFSRLLGIHADEVDLRSIGDDAPLDGEGEIALFESPDIAIAAALRPDFRGGWRSAFVVAPDADNADPAQLRFTLLFTTEMLKRQSFEEVRFLQFEDAPSFDGGELDIVQIPAPERIAARLERPPRPASAAPSVVALFDGGAEPDMDLIGWLAAQHETGSIRPCVVSRDTAAREEAARVLDGVHLLSGGEIAPSWLISRTDCLLHAGRRNWMTPFIALAARSGVPVLPVSDAAGRLSAARQVAIPSSGSAGQDSGAADDHSATAWLSDVVRLARRGVAA